MQPGTVQRQPSRANTWWARGVGTHQLAIAVIEHDLEGSARARVQATRDRAEAGAEEPRNLRGHVRDPDIGLFAAPVFGTDLHTLGELERVVGSLAIAQAGRG